MFEQVQIPRKLKQRLGRAISIVMSAAMLVTALPADLLGGIMSVKAADASNAMILDITELAADTSNPMGLDSEGKATFSESQTFGAFTVTVEGSNTVSVDKNAKTWEDPAFSFTHRLKLGGAGSPTARGISFTTDGAATVVVYAISSSSTAGSGARLFRLHNADVLDEDGKGIVVGTYEDTNIPGDSVLHQLVMPKIEEAGTYYLASASGGVNVYRVEVIPDASGDGTDDGTDSGSDEGLKLRSDDLAGLIEEGKTAYEFTSETRLGNSVFSVATSGSNNVTIEYGGGDSVDGTVWKMPDESDTFYYRLKLNGAGSMPSAEADAKRAIKFTPTKDGRFIVYAISGSSSADRTLVLNDGETTVNLPALGAEITVSEAEVKAGVTYYLYSAGSGINLYYLELNYSPKAPEPVVRGPWDEVEAPVITDVALKEGDDTKISVTVDAFIESDGADKVEVSMIDVKGDAVATQSTSVKSKKDAATGEYDNAHTLEFTPTASGDYTFIARLIREDEEDKVSAESKVITFKLPLAIPVIKGVTNKGTVNGKGKIEIAWQKVTEANSYEITVTTTKTAAGETSNAKQSVTTIALQTTVEGLEIGSEVEVAVVAVRTRDNSKSEAALQTATVNGETERTWYFAAYGSSTSVDSTNIENSKNGYKKLSEDSVQVWSESGAGKIVPASTDGLAYYYTTIDPDTENFTLTADVKVDSWTYSNGQDGFGMMVSDTVGETGDTSAFWNNSFQLISTKIEYRWDPEANDGMGAVTTKDVVDPIRRYSMRLGLGWIARTGVTALDVANINAGTAGAPASFSSTSSTLETTAAVAALPGGDYNLLGNITNPSDAIPTYGIAGLAAANLKPFTEFKMQIQRNNTGYILRYLSSTETDENGKPVVLSEQTFYDFDRNVLTQIDKKNIYVGFFAGRNARMTASNITLTTIDPDEDEAAEEREVTTVISNYTISSPTYSNSSYYDLIFSSNQDGNLTILGENDKVITMNAELSAGSKYVVGTNLKLGENKFDFTFVPSQDYTPGEYQIMSDYDTVTIPFTVTYQELTGDSIYVSPEGKSDNAGTAESPLDIYTAVNFAHAGQTIYLAGGTYNMVDIAKNVGMTEDVLLIGKGHDGTEKEPITMKAVEGAVGDKRPILDFKGQVAAKSAFIMAGDYWHLKGFDVTNSAASQKGIQVSGDYNLLEDLRTYMNGNTGIQIARYGSDSRVDWPSYNTVLNCTSYMNTDPGYEDADGFAAKLTISDGNRFVGCIAAYNADDGWDLFAKVETGSIGAVTIENCLAFKNGYVLGTREVVDGKTVDVLSLDATTELTAGNGNGFKMGGESLPGAHVLINSVAFANRAKGIDSNSCPDIQVYNSISFNNEGYNVAFYTNNGAISTDYYAEGVISYRTSGATMDASAIKGDQLKPQTQNLSKIYGTSNYYFDGTAYVNSLGEKAADDWFKSMDVDKAIHGGITRNADGSINLNGFLELTDKAPEGVGAVLGNTSYETIIGNTKPIELNVIAATVTTLKQVTLPEGYTWAYPDTATAVFAGTKSEFIAKDEAGTERAVVVNFIEATGVELVADKVSLIGDAALKLTAKPVFAPEVTEAEFNSAQGTISLSYDIKESSKLKLAVAAVDGETNAKNVTRAADSGEGLAKFTAVMTVTVNGKSSKKQATYSFTTRKTPFEFTYNVPTEGVEKSESGITVSAGVTSFTLDSLKVTGVTGGEGVKVTSSDSKILKVNGTTITVVSEGTATLTLTATADKTVVQLVPVLVQGLELKANVSTITVDKAKISGAQITAVACYGTALTAGSVSVKSVLKGKNAVSDYVAKFTIQNVVGNIYSISADESIPNGTYSLVLQGKLADSAEDAAFTEFEPLTVKVVETKPTVTIKQTKKVNLFYKYNSTTGRGSLTASSKLAGVTLTQTDTTSDFTLASSGKSGAYTVSLKKAAADKKTPVKKITATASFSGYKESYNKTVTINVSTENRAPQLVLEVDNKVLYTQLGINDTEIRIVDKATNTYLSGADVTLASSTSAYQKANANFSLDEENGVYVLGALKSGSAKISVLDVEWTKEVVISQSITVNTKAPKATFAVAKLNSTQEFATLEQANALVTVKNAKDFKVKDLVLTGANAKAIELLDYLDYSVTLDEEGQNVLQVSLNRELPVQANGKSKFSGTYSYKASFKLNKLEQTATVKVNIAALATVTTKQSGSIDLVNRSGSSISVKPTLKNLNGTVVNMYLKDDASNQFDVQWDSAKQAAVVSAKALTDMKKGGKYKVTPVFEVQLENGLVEVEAKTITITPKQSTVKVTSILPMETRLSAPSITATASVKATSPANAEIASMTQMNYMDQIAVDYDAKSGTLFVQLADTAGLKANSTYKVTMVLEIQDAGVNVKKQTIMVPVKVLN